MSAELREFLSLLANVPDPAPALHLVRTYFPQRAPLDVAEEWLRALGELEFFEDWSESLVEPFRRYLGGTRVAEVRRLHPRALEAFCAVRLAS